MKLPLWKSQPGKNSHFLRLSQLLLVAAVRCPAGSPLRYTHPPFDVTQRRNPTGEVVACHNL
jgi:hypothetical protein